MASIIYVLYLATLFPLAASLAGLLTHVPLWVNAVTLCAPIGLVLAYFNRSRGPEWLRSHYRFQIRTFWIVPIFYLLSLAVVWVISYGVAPLVSFIIVGMRGGNSYEVTAAVMAGFSHLFAIIGYHSVILCFVWLIIRCAKGLWHMARGQAHPKPASLLF